MTAIAEPASWKKKAAGRPPQREGMQTLNWKPGANSSCSIAWKPGRSLKFEWRRKIALWTLAGCRSFGYRESKLRKAWRCSQPMYVLLNLKITATTELATER